MHLPLHDYEISVVDSLLAVGYMPFDYVGRWLGVNSVRYRVETDDDSSVLDVEGKSRSSFLGALAYFKLRF